MVHDIASAPRLYIEPSARGYFEAGLEVAVSASQHSYLRTVLRLGEGDSVLTFNGRDGEWRAVLVAVSRKQTALRLETLVRSQTQAGRLHYFFAPLKHARLDYIVQKAVEMGASVIRPVLTRRTQTTRINLDRMRANAIEAAEQCGILALPAIEDPIALPALLGMWGERMLIFCDEEAPSGDALATLKASNPRGDAAILIGPEGGFDEEERATLLARPSIVRLCLGPRILRADTAGVAALALVQATIGDWLDHANLAP